jgi:hypothetical protein
VQDKNWVFFYDVDVAALIPTTCLNNQKGGRGQWLYDDGWKRDTSSNNAGPSWKMCCAHAVLEGWSCAG